MLGFIFLDSKSIVFYIPVMSVLMLDSQCMLISKYPSLSRIFCLQNFSFFDPFFSGKYEKLFSSLYSLYSLITRKRQKNNILCSLCLLPSYVFVQREALTKVAQLRNFIRFFHTRPRRNLLSDFQIGSNNFRFS